MSSGNDFMKGFIMGQLVGLIKGFALGFVFFKWVLPKLIEYLEDYFYAEEYLDDDFEGVEEIETEKA